ncbi:hypothetical protein [Desulfospira joergensenii]|uniref:hypothetical protein n=1 Tax=Desulfospira joergensenii TaxID=53329 RepID=UPI0003B6DBE9|nr:hypothetical protein [Desulfospira joergensenii]
MNKHCDLHLHLSGSISKELLIEFAKSDDNKKAIDDIETADVLKMFKIIHDLTNSPERIEASTENVINTSTADYLEIRTTPRYFSSTTPLRHSVGAFVAGLKKHPKKAKGLLSINRYMHDVKSAQKIIEIALEFPDHIVGIDISGINPEGIRILQGDDLKQIVETILNSSLGLAIHIGELNLEKDSIDSTIALNAIDQWLDQNQIDCFGKIRLGHALFLEEDHKRIIRKHRLPIEICPSCHRYLGAWNKSEGHPVQQVYSDKDSPIVIGTDDTLIFSTNFQRELALARKELPYSLENQCNYRFTHNP